MKTNDNNKSAGGIGFTSALQIAFIVLKLCGVIGWPWVWVLAPTWITIAFVIIVVIIITMGVNRR